MQHIMHRRGVLPHTQRKIDFLNALLEEAPWLEETTSLRRNHALRAIEAEMIMKRTEQRCAYLHRCALLREFEKDYIAFERDRLKWLAMQP